MGKMLELLLAERNRSPYRFRFTGELEAMYRADLRELLRVTRVALFFAIAMAFALAPFQEVILFKAPLPMLGSLLLFAQTMTPVSLAAAALTYLRGPSVLVQGFQAAVVVGALIAMLALRYVALISDFRYPVGMLGTGAIAVAIFGGFSWRPMATGLIAFFSFGIVQEYVWTHAGTSLEAYQLVFASVVALLGSYTNEVLRRQNWLQKECATALSRVDSLSGLSNRGDFDRRIQMTLQQARRDKRMVAVMVLDIDHFKKINDRHGHSIGDVALGAVADAINRSSAQRPMDIKARTGGEEFVVVWYDVAIAAVPALVERVLDALRAIQVPLEKGAKPLTLTASAGACWAVPDNSTTADALVQQADALMYRAKQAGRNQACLEQFRP